VKPSPRPRKTPVVPKAVGPDPALIGASSTSNPANHASVASSASARGGDSVPPSSHGRDGGHSAPTVKITVRVPTSLADRARGAYRLSLAGPEPPTSFSAWVAGAIADAVAAAEAAHGPLPPTPAGVLPTGRPSGR